jgi:hypothetical protein
MDTSESSYETVLTLFMTRWLKYAIFIAHSFDCIWKEGRGIAQ